MGQSVTLSRPNDGPLVAPLQKFAPFPERADFVEKVLVISGGS
jgi:hypothetical protein